MHGEAFGSGRKENNIPLIAVYVVREYSIPNDLYIYTHTQTDDMTCKFTPQLSLR